MANKGLIGGVVGVLILGTAVAWAVSRQSGAESAADAKDKPVTLEFRASEVMQAREMAMPVLIQFSGPLVAPGTVVVRAKASGTLASLAVAEGSRVRAGDRLGSIDLADLNARLNERQAQLEAAQAQLRQAERTHQNNQRLAEQQFIAPSAVDASGEALESARAQWRSAQAQLETVRVALREAHLSAPIAGIVAKRHVLPGEKVTAEQPVLTVVDLRQLEMAGAVGTHEVGRLRPGLPVQVQVEGVDTKLQGTLSRIAPAAEPGTRSIGVTVLLNNPQEQLRAGQFASARVQLPAAVARQAVPATALGASSGQDYVWTLEQDKLMRRVVVTGRRDAQSGWVEITEGLPAQVLVLATRFDNLREGAPAKVVTTATAAAAASSAH